MHDLLHAPLPLRGLERDDEVGGRQEADFPALVRGDQPEGDGKVRLTGARWPEQDDVLGTLDEAERGELLYLRTRGAGGEREVVRLKRLLRREAGGPGQHLERPHTPRLAFGAQDLLQEVGIAGIFPLRGRLGDRAVDVRQRGQSQLDGQRLDPIALQRAHGRTSGNSAL